MQVASLEPRDAAAVAELWLAGALESSAADSSFAPRQSPAECAASVESDLASGAYFGWGVFEASERHLFGYLTARVEKPSEVFTRSKSLYLLDLDVRPSARRQGLATSLVATARRH